MQLHAVQSSFLDCLKGTLYTQAHISGQVLAGFCQQLWYLIMKCQLFAFFPFGNGQISTLLLSAGLYACKEGSNSPCLVYVSFSQKIYIYWDVQLERMESTNLLKILDGDPEFESLLEQLGIGECRKRCTEWRMYRKRGRAAGR